jgi:hypothetical protein
MHYNERLAETKIGGTVVPGLAILSSSIEKVGFTTPRMHHRPSRRRRATQLLRVAPLVRSRRPSRRYDLDAHPVPRCTR